MPYAHHPPPPWGLTALAAVAWLWVLACVPVFSDAAADVFLGLPLLAAGFLLFLGWLGVSLWHYGRGVPRARRAWTVAAWVLTAEAFVAVAGLALTDWDFQLRAALSEQALLDHADAVRAGTVPEDEPRWVGLFWVERTEVEGGSAAFMTCTSFLDRYGLVYQPPGEPPPIRVRVRERVSGDWYRAYWKF